MVDQTSETEQPLGGMCSGSIRVEDMEVVQVQIQNQIVSFSGWIAAPASWPIVETIRISAHNLGLRFEVHSTRRSGWIFKRDTYSFTVSGLRSAMDVFNKWFDELVRANSSSND
ncbi:MAG: hypothetical protein V3T23_05530 [Nitrososphaerales archaeon]